MLLKILSLIYNNSGGQSISIFVFKQDAETLKRDFCLIELRN